MSQTTSRSDSPAPIDSVRSEPETRVLGLVRDNTIHAAIVVRRSLPVNPESLVRDLIFAVPHLSEVQIPGRTAIELVEAARTHKTSGSANALPLSLRNSWVLCELRAPGGR